MGPGCAQVFSTFYQTLPHLGRFLISSLSCLQSFLELLPVTLSETCGVSTSPLIPGSQQREFSIQTAKPWREPRGSAAQRQREHLASGTAGFWAAEEGAGRGGRAPRRRGKLAIRHGKEGAVPNPWAPLQLFKASR